MLVKVVRARRVKDPDGFLGLCFAADGGGLNIPVITAHFAGGADVDLLPMHTFNKVVDNLSCLTLTPSDAFGILGNLAQAVIQPSDSSGKGERERETATIENPKFIFK